MAQLLRAARGATAAVAEVSDGVSVAGVPKELLGPDIQAEVLQEARALLEQAQSRCQQLLGSKRSALDALARALLQREVLCGAELKALLGTDSAPLPAAAECAAFACAQSPRP